MMIQITEAQVSVRVYPKVHVRTFLLAAITDGKMCSNRRNEDWHSHYLGVRDQNGQDDRERYDYF